MHEISSWRRIPSQSLGFLAVPSGTHRLCQQEHDTDAPGSEAHFDRCGVAALTVTPVGVELLGLITALKLRSGICDSSGGAMQKPWSIWGGVVGSMGCSGALFFDLCIPEFLSHQLKI